MVLDDYHKITLASGRSFHEYGGWNYLSPYEPGRVAAGYDDSFPDSPEKPLTRAECDEIAAKMITRWREWVEQEPEPESK